MEGGWNPKAARNLHNPNIADLLDDRTAGRIAKNLNPAKPSVASGAYAGKRTKPTVGKAADSDLLASMAQKLTQQQKINTSLKKEIQEKSQMVDSLKEEVATLKRAVAPDAVEQFRAVQQENAQLKRQVKEMEDFLNDYGLKWVGREGNLDVNAINQALGGAAPMYRYNLPKEIDVIVLERRIQELNMIAERDASKLVAQGGIHRFKAPDSVAIVFFKNGLVLQGFPFRPYSSNEAQSLLSDILDGYFPYDLKRKYPDGVPLRIVDKTEEMFSAETSVHSANNPDLGMLSKDAFLAQLPQNVIRGGEIIPIREEVGEMFGPKTAGSGTVEIRTHVDEHLATAGETPELLAQVTTIRVKTETGRRNLILRLWKNDTVGVLARYVDQHRETKGNYEIRSTFPARVYDKAGGETLEALDMVPSYALALRVAE